MGGVKSVDYELEVHDELPARPDRAAGGGASVLEDQLGRIVGNEGAHHPRWARIGKYANSAAAGSAALTLRKRHGDTPEVEGWRFETRRIDNGEATGLFAQYNPRVIVPGKKEENAKVYREWRARQAEARRVTLEEKARAEAEQIATDEQHATATVRKARAATGGD